MTYRHASVYVHLLVDIKGGVVAEDHAAGEVVLRHGVMLQIIHPRLLTPCRWPSSVLCFCVSARAWLIRLRGGGGVPGRQSGSGRDTGDATGRASSLIGRAPAGPLPPYACECLHARACENTVVCMQRHVRTRMREYSCMHAEARENAHVRIQLYACRGT